MYLSGIGDEAGQDLTSQIRAHQELGWSHIELRQVDGQCITDVDDQTFDRIADQLSAAGLSVSCFAAQLANWSRPIDTDFAVDEAELSRAIPRMQQLGTRWIRCMSYPNCDPPLADADWRRQVLDRMRRLTELAEQGDVVLVHENCHGWAGPNAHHACQMLDEINSPHLKLVFDTGNPLCYGQDAWQEYQTLQNGIVYVHIKDYRADHAPVRGEEDVTATMPGEGDCCVDRIVKDLLQRGYDGGFSIEPHITSVIHRSQEASDPELAYRTYVEYGKQLERLLAQHSDV